MLGLPTLNAVSQIHLEGNHLLVERNLEDEVEVVEVPLPAVLSVTTDINQPRLPTMKEILKSSKKPIQEWSLAELGIQEEVKRQIEVISVRAPHQVQRKKVVISGSPQEEVQALVGYLSKEGIL
jgi:electron transfer flavoprotein beta subunit